MIRLQTRSFICGWVATFAACGGLSSRAAVLPVATSSVTCQTSIGPISGTSFCSTAIDLAQVTLAPFAGTHAEATYPGSFDIADAGADAQLRYNWVVEGGTPGDVVPVSIDVHLIADVFGSNDARAFASVISSTIASGFAQVCVETSGLCQQGAHGFDGTMHVNARVGDMNFVEMQATASGTFSADVNGGSASADPHIYVDPTFASADSYKIVLSFGVSNDLAPVPTPTALGLFGSGWVALVGRRRRYGQRCST